MSDQQQPKRLRDVIVDAPLPKSAYEFLQMLEPTSNLLIGFSRGSHKLIYRGVTLTVDHRLEPSAFRNGSVVGKIPRPVLGGKQYSEAANAELIWVFREARTLREYVERCNEVGLYLPSDFDVAIAACKRIEQSVRRICRALTIKDDLNGFELEWPPTELTSCLSLAQHNRLPTRLLDFTERARHAAFFATDFDPSALDQETRRRNRSCAVYCMRADFASRIHTDPPDAENIDQVPDGRYALNDQSFYTHRRPMRYGNVNAAAQYGSFVFRVSKFRYRQMDDLRQLGASESLRAFDDLFVSEDETLGVRVACPFELVPDVNHLLRKEGIAKRHVYPDYRTTAEELVRELPNCVLQPE